MYKLEKSGIDVIETDDLQEEYADSEKPEADAFKDDLFTNQKEFEYDPSTKTLQHRLHTLWLEMQQLNEDEDESLKKEKTEMTDDIKSLQNLLSNVDPFSKVNLSDPQGNTHKKLLSSIEAISKQSESKSGNKDVDNKDVASNQMFYQLNQPISNNFDNVQKLKELEKRVSNLDGSLGNLTSLPTPLLIDAHNKTILDIVSGLAMKSKVLETQNWTDVEVKAGAVIKRMDQILEKKDLLDQKSKMDKLSELYTMMLRWRKVARVLPLISQNLQGLKTLHNHALEFNQCLNHLEVTQQQLVVQLQSHKHLIEAVKTDLSSNAAVIKAKYETLQQKINNIK